MLSNKNFRDAWEGCSDHGECDAIDGAEYSRVFQEWESAGRPFDVPMGRVGGSDFVELQNFIRRHANALPAGDGN